MQTSRRTAPPQPDLVHRPLELRHRARLVHAGVDQHDPSPAAIAQALQCGTPGHGSGSRSRQRPGSTRSPRPSLAVSCHGAHEMRSDLDSGARWPSARRNAAREARCPGSEYRDANGNVLTLRGSLTPGRAPEYADTLAGGLQREDAWQRATELLFERLAVSWTIAGLEITRQKELLGRYRMATGTSGGSSAIRCASTSPSTSRSCRRRDRSRRLRGAALRLVHRGARAIRC